jgi:hypothetical protein
MELKKIASGEYQYKGVKVFKYRNGFSYWFTNREKEYPVSSKTYPDTLKKVIAELDLVLANPDVFTENNRVIIADAKVSA